MGEEGKMEVIILGAGGGPREDNTTSLLVRSTSTSWEKNSVLAIDAGVHMSSIAKIIERSLERRAPDAASVTKLPMVLTNGPFTGLTIKNENVDAIAIGLIRDTIETHLMTHAHLDHIAGFVVNSSGFNATERKTLAGMPTTIESIKKHIFNGIIWPNLSNENGGYNLITYLRMVPGGNSQAPNGGYIKLCEGLHVKGVYVAHGSCAERHFRDPDIPVHSSPLSPQRPGVNYSIATSHAPEYPPSESHHFGPEFGADKNYVADGIKYVTDSTAYFIRDVASNQEIIVFGDLEADSISEKDLNKQMWTDAAPKFVAGLLKGLFIECSYDNSRERNRLFGHLTPFFLFEELQVLAGLVEESKSPAKRTNTGYPGTRIATRGHPKPTSLHTGTGQKGDSFSTSRFQWNKILKGLKVVIIHVKETCEDGPSVNQRILSQLQELEEKNDLGCEFIMSYAGQAVYL